MPIRSRVLVLLSPSKTQDFHGRIALPEGVAPTAPRLLDVARQVVEAQRMLAPDELHRRLTLPAGLYEKFDRALDRWSGRGATGRPAAFAYVGETYRGLAVRDWDGPALARAQQQLRILSAVYGVLRPLDRIEQYRLDFGSGLQVGRARSLYALWRGPITARLAEDARETGAEAVVNLASGEFSRAVDAQGLGVPVMTADFLQQIGEELKRVTVFSKQARGAMARWIVETGAATRGELEGFDRDGYRVAPTLCSPAQLVFVRPAPP